MIGVTQAVDDLQHHRKPLSAALLIETDRVVSPNIQIPRTNHPQDLPSRALRLIIAVGHMEMNRQKLVRSPKGKAPAPMCPARDAIKEKPVFRQSLLSAQFGHPVFPRSRRVFHAKRKKEN